MKKKNLLKIVPVLLPLFLSPARTSAAVPEEQFRIESEDCTYELNSGARGVGIRVEEKAVINEYGHHNWTEFSVPQKFLPLREGWEQKFLWKEWPEFSTAYRYSKGELVVIMIADSRVETINLEVDPWLKNPGSFKSKSRGQGLFRLLGGNRKFTCHF